MAKIFIHGTHGQEDPVRATLAFIVANVVALADQKVVMLLTIEGVWLATQAYADTIHQEEFPPRKEVMPVYATEKANYPCLRKEAMWQGRAVFCAPE